MNLWRTRTDSLAYLEQSRGARMLVLNDLLETIDRCIGLFESKSQNDTYARVNGLTLLKAKNLWLGAYSLMLDGLAQEAGGLLRPFIEYMELLTYFRQFPDMVERAVENDLPKAGERARAVQGSFKEFREHLNQHASHSSYSRYSLSHLLEPGTFAFKKFQRHVPQVIDRNLTDGVVQLYLLLHEAVLNLERLQVGDFEQQAVATEVLRQRVIKEFGLDAA